LHNQALDKEDDVYKMLYGGINLQTNYTVGMAKLSQIISVENENQGSPNTFMLFWNYPNPFNAMTKISYSIPKSSFVSLAIYNILGKKVHTLVNEFQQAGKYTFDFDASKLSNGVYFYKLQVGNGFSDTKKMLFVK